MKYRVPIYLCAALLLRSSALLNSTGQEISPLDLSPKLSLEQPHPFGVHDMVRMERVGEPEVSPDGKQIAFTIRKWDPETNKATTNLWLIGTHGGPPRQLTSGQGQSNASATWSPDSRSIAFISNRGGSRQLWAIAVAGGEALPLTNLPIDVDNPRWSPSGGHIAFSAEVYPDAGPAATAARDKAKADDSLQARKYDRLPVRHWDTWKDGKRSHLFVATLKQDETSGTWHTRGEPLDLLRGIDADCPTKPFGGREDFDWSPDGREIAYTAQLGDDFAWSTDLNVFVVPVTGGSSKPITTANKASDVGPVYSPDGRSIAYRAMARPGFESDRYRVMLYDRVNNTTKAITEGWDRSPSSLAWSSDAKALFAIAADAARQKIFRLDSATGQPQAIVSEHYCSGLSIAAGTAGRPPRLVFSQDSLLAPAELWTAALDGRDRQQLTHFTDAKMKLVRTGQVTEFTFPGANGEKVQAWLIKPVSFEEGKKYPVAFIIHGGPQGAIEDHFHYRWNPQAFAGAGYAVIAVNFHGSTGFGQAFTDSISGDWGGKPFEDLMKGLDYALANNPWLDGNRVAALGASYGGWMINWINGHSNRFKCLVNHDGGFDEFANYFTTEELWFPEWEFKGVPWERPELYDKFSPSRYIANWQTPTLVIHGANDFRLVDAEGLATFTALQRRKIPSQLLYFPDENHWILKPKNSIVWHTTILAWLEKWL